MAQLGTIQAHIEEMTTLLSQAKSPATQETPTTVTREKGEASPATPHVDSAFATDDIPDPALPKQMLADIEAQRLTHATVDPSTATGQMVMAVEDVGAHVAQHAAAVLTSLEKSWDVALLYARENQQILEALTGALQNYAPGFAYSATISAVSPLGFPMSLNVSNATLEGFMTQMTIMMALLTENQFMPHVAPPF